MQMALFLKNKIQRQLQMNGRSVTFTRYKVDEYKQLTDEVEANVEICGLYHTTNVYIKNTDNDNTRLVSKPQPMLLMLYEDGAKLQKDDVATMQERKYKVTEKNDVNNLGVVYDVSLELIDGRC